MLRPTVFLALTLFAFVVQAEVIDLEGTVKAVDAEARTISIERKTPKGTKTLELEVTKKAGDLGSVKAGDKISFSYDPDLEVVTKFGGGNGAEAETAQKDKAAAGVRITYTYAADGSTKTTLRALGAQEGRDNQPQKEEVKPGVWRMTHVFNKADAVSQLEGPLLDMTGVSFDGNRKALFINPKSDGGNKTAMQYPVRFRLPMTVEIDAVPATERVALQITPNANTPQNIHPFVTISTQDGFRTVDIVDSWVVARDPNSGQPDIKDVEAKRRAATSDTIVVEGKSPVAISPEEIHLLRLGAFAGGPATGDGYYIQRLSIEARFAPTLGLALKQDGDNVVAKDVLKKSLAEKAGIKTGDVVISIDGKKPGTTQRAMQLLSMTSYGDTWSIEAQRDGEKKTFTIKAE